MSLWDREPVDLPEVSTYLHPNSRALPQLLLVTVPPGLFLSLLIRNVLVDICSVAIFTLLIWTLVRFRVTATDEGAVVRNLFRTERIRWVDVEWVGVRSIGPLKISRSVVIQMLNGPRISARALSSARFEFGDDMMWMDKAATELRQRHKRANSR